LCLTEADQAVQETVAVADVNAVDNHENVIEQVGETHEAENSLKRKRETLKTPKCKITPRATLSDMVRRLNSQVEEHGHTNVTLQEINTSLKQLVQLKSEKLELEKLKLRLKYPDVSFDFSEG
jgi:hypothetical protein